MASTSNNAERIIKRDRFIAASVLSFILLLPLITFAGAMHLQFLNRRTGDVIEFVDQCFVRHLSRLQKPRHLIDDFIPCREVEIRRDELDRLFIRSGEVSKGVVSFKHLGVDYTAPVWLYEPQTRSRARDEGIVWFVDQKKMNKILDVIDDEWHAVRFLRTTWRFVWAGITQPIMMIVIVFIAGTHIFGWYKAHFRKMKSDDEKIG